MFPLALTIRLCDTARSRPMRSPILALEIRLGFLIWAFYFPTTFLFLRDRKPAVEVLKFRDQAAEQHRHHHYLCLTVQLFLIYYALYIGRGRDGRTIRRSLPDLLLDPDCRHSVRRTSSPCALLFCHSTLAVLALIATCG